MCLISSFPRNVGLLSHLRRSFRSKRPCNQLQDIRKRIYSHRYGIKWLQKSFMADLKARLSLVFLEHHKTQRNSLCVAYGHNQNLNSHEFHAFSSLKSSFLKDILSLLPFKLRVRSFHLYTQRGTNFDLIRNHTCKT